MSQVNKRTRSLRMPRSTRFEATMRGLAVSAAAVAIVISVLSAAQVEGQSSKGLSATSRPASSNSYANSPAPSPVAQLRQQQQQQTTTNYQRPATTGASTKRRPQQQQQTQQQQQQSYSGDDSPSSTEDPLADSEPALYGSVAGKPGVDFPAYTRIPKTSFTCEGKGFDFGFYADEEAACQVYHVCWSGRRESFLCGVGTVFNQAILACDYWHSVDCSKSSQFYGVNSELGKASAEPASQGSQRQGPARTQATLPPPVSSSSSSLGGSPATSSNNVGTNYGEPINQRRVGSQQQQQPVVQQQQQFTSDDSNFDLSQQQVQVPSYKSVDRQQQQPTVTSQPASRDYGATFTPQRSQPTYDYQQQQQRTIQPDDSPVKTSSQRTPVAPATTSAPLPPPPAVKRPRFNMDFNQKVTSLIDSPVRPPIKSSPAKQPQRQQQQQAPAAVAKQQPNFAQQAVNRAQQGGSQSLNGGFSRKGNQVNYAPVQQQRQEPPPQQQQTYDNELDEPQQQQQQQTFDDSPVQTSTAQTAPIYSGNRNQQQQQQPNFVPQQAIQTIRAGGSGDGSSSITTQYDTLNLQQGNQNAPTNDQSYESNLDDQSSSNLNDDFRSAGAKAAASQNQNWYIMRSI